MTDLAKMVLQHKSLNRNVYNDPFPGFPGQGMRTTRRIPQAHPIALDVGMLGWISEREYVGDLKCIRPGHCGEATGREPGLQPYHHPVIICAVEQKTGSTRVGDLECVFVSCTTFTHNPGFEDTKLEDVLNRTEQKFRECIPIRHPSGADLRKKREHADFVLASGEDMIDQTYVRMQCIYRVPIDAIWTKRWNHGKIYDIRLNEDGYKRMMDTLGFLSQRYHTLYELYALGIRRLEQIAWGQVQLSLKPPSAFELNPLAPAFAPLKLKSWASTPQKQLQGSSQIERTHQHASGQGIMVTVSNDVNAVPSVLEGPTSPVRTNSQELCAGSGMAPDLMGQVIEDAISELEATNINEGAEEENKESK